MKKNKKKISQLEARLNYHFNNKELLSQALTRQKAIEEKIAGAAKQSYQALEFVGDPALKAILTRILYKKFSGAAEWQLHELTQELIQNIKLPVAARHLKLEEFVIKGQSEPAITDKMLADAFEAVIGAIFMDAKEFKPLERILGDCFKSELALLQLPSPKVVSEPSAIALRPSSKVLAPKESSTIRLSPPTVLAPHSQKEMLKDLSEVELKIRPQPTVPPKDELIRESDKDSDELKQYSTYDIKPNNGSSSASSPTPNREAKSKPGLYPPLSPRTTRLFSALSSSDLKGFQKALDKAPHAVNVCNQGKRGDTPLMLVLRKRIKKNKPRALREDRDLPRIYALVQAGALWSKPNKKGETAEQLLQKFPQESQKLCKK